MTRPIRKPRRRNFPSDAPAANRDRRVALAAKRLAAGQCPRCGDEWAGLRRWCADCRKVRLMKHAARVAP